MSRRPSRQRRFLESLPGPAAWSLQWSPRGSLAVPRHRAGLAIELSTRREPRPIISGWTRRLPRTTHSPFPYREACRRATSKRGMRSRRPAPTIVLCEAPALHGGGFTTVSVGVDGSDGAVFGLATRGAVEFEYETPARVASVMPTVGMTEGGTVVRVSGAHFSLTNRPCGFGGASPFDAEVISSAMVVCESPARAQRARCRSRLAR